VTSHCPEGSCETMARVSAVMLCSSGDEGQYAGVRCSGGWRSQCCACDDDSFVDCGLTNKGK